MIRVSAVICALLGCAVCVVTGVASPNVCQWTPVAPFPVAGYQYDPVAFSRYLYVLGGYDNNVGSFDSVMIGKVSAEGDIEWTESPHALPVPDQGPSATIYNGWLYTVLTNGHVYRSPLFPDGSIGPWLDEGVGLPYRGGFMSAEAYDGYLYVMGGFGAGCSMHADVIVAPLQPDGSVGEWRSTTSMPEPRQHQSVHFYKGRAYIIGGISGCTGPILASASSAPVEADTGLLGDWRPETPLPVPLWYHKSLLIGNEIVVVGGLRTYTGGSSRTIYRAPIDPVTGSLGPWTAACELTSSASHGIGAVWLESLNVAYLIGGYVDGQGVTAEVRRSRLPAECHPNGYWRSAAPKPDAAQQTSAVEVDGMVYVLGDHNYSAENNRLYRYDPATDGWERLANIPTGRGLGAAAAVNGTIYYFGGNNCFSNCWLTTAEAYDIASNQWSALPPIPGEPRGMLSAVAYNGRIFVMGGVNSYTLPTYSYNYVFDPATNSWSEATPLPRPRAGHAAVLLNRKIYVIGGSYRYSHFSSWSIPEIDVYDPDSDTWSVVPDAAVLRSECTAVAAGDRIYVMGGFGRAASGGPDGAMIQQVEEFDPATNCWRAVLPLPAPRARASAVALGDRVCLVGGTDGAADSSTVWVGAPRPVVGDLNGDGLVNNFDIDAFVAVLNALPRP